MGIITSKQQILLLMEKFLVDLLMTVAPLKDSLLEENQELHLSKEYFQLHST